jgi:hypothetical protein
VVADSTDIASLEIMTGDNPELEQTHRWTVSIYSFSVLEKRGRGCAESAAGTRSYHFGLFGLESRDPTRNSRLGVLVASFHDKI